MIEYNFNYICSIHYYDFDVGNED